MDAHGTDALGERQGGGNAGSVNKGVRVKEGQGTSGCRRCMGKERQDDNVRIDLDDGEEVERSKRNAMPIASLPRKNGLVTPEPKQVPSSRYGGLDAIGRNHPNRPDDDDDETVDVVAVQLEENRLFAGDTQPNRQNDIEDKLEGHQAKSESSLPKQLKDLHVRIPASSQSQPDNASCATGRNSPKSIYNVIRQPVEILSHLHASRMSAYITREVASFNKKALKSNALKVTEHSHLKLGTLASTEINTLYTWLRVTAIGIPLLQIFYGFYGSLKESSDSNQRDLGGNGMGPDATIQAVLLLTSTAFIQRITFYKRRQRIQSEVLKLAGLVWVFSALSFVANTWNTLYPATDSSRELMGVSNTLMAGLLYRTLTHFSDFYTDLVAGWSAIEHRPSLDHRKTGWRWLKYITGKRFSQVFPVFIVSYMVLRLVLGWRNSVVFDFLPLTNIITPARLNLVYGKRVDQPHLLLDSAVITVYEAVLLGVALYKCSCAYDSFRRIFVQDFARIFTEFGVFVVYFRNTILYMMIGGHIAAWSVPFNRLFSRVDWNESATAIRVIQMGAVQQQLGYLFCFAIWFITTMHCALPDDSVGLKGWFTGTNVIKHKHQSIKYFLYESDVYMKTKFTNLKDIEHIDPSHFVMDKQVEAFNLAQLVYTCGKHESSFDDPVAEIAHIQKLIMDPQFTIVEIIQDKATDTHCLLLASSTMIVATFRGTSSKTNAKTDLKAAMSVHRTAKQLDFAKMPSISGRSRQLNTAKLQALAQTKRTWWHRILCKRNSPKVHSGFYAAYLSVEKRVLTRIKALHDQNPRKILATGHSLGGALAVLCSFDVVAQLKITNVTCTTFGCPRVGNTAFKKKYNHAVPATFAFVNAADLVTKLPPKTPKALSYMSVGTIVLINAFGNLVIAPNVLELAVLHKGYSAMAHTLKAYHLSLLLWCLRSHKMQYHPRFWRQPREFLEANYSHLPDIQEYLKVCMAESTPTAGRLRRWRQVPDISAPNP